MTKQVNFMAAMLGALVMTGCVDSATEDVDQGAPEGAFETWGRCTDCGGNGFSFEIPTARVNDLDAAYAHTQGRHGECIVPTTPDEHTVACSAFGKVMTSGSSAAIYTADFVVTLPGLTQVVNCPVDYVAAYYTKFVAGTGRCEYQFALDRNQVGQGWIRKCVKGLVPVKEQLDYTCDGGKGL